MEVEKRDLDLFISPEQIIVFYRTASLGKNKTHSNYGIAFADNALQ